MWSKNSCMCVSNSLLWCLHRSNIVMLQCVIGPKWRKWKLGTEFSNCSVDAKLRCLVCETLNNHYLCTARMGFSLWIARKYRK